MDPLFLPLALIGFAVFLFVSGRSARKRQAAMAEELRNNLEPGVWVMTSSGFYGRFVERDGDVVVLETVDGTETFWSTMAIRQTIDELPFATSDDEPSVEDDAPDVLGSAETTAGNAAGEAAADIPVAEDKPDHSKPTDRG